MPDRYNIASEVCDAHPRDQLAMIWEDATGRERQVRWGELQDLSARLANALTAAGVTAGDRVAAVLPPRPEAAAAMLAVLRTGAILITMSRMWSAHEIEHRLRDAEPKVLITESEDSERLDSSLVDEVLLLDRFDPSSYSSHFITVDTAADDPAFIAYTSGTTGPAKGVVIPHRAMLAADEATYVQDLQPGELTFSVGDWAWSYRKIMAPWRLGAVNLSYEQHGRFDPERMLDVLARHQVTNAFINVTVIRLLMQQPGLGRKYPQQFRVVATSNERLGVEPFEYFQAEFGVPPLEFYGATESFPMIGNSPYLPIKPGSMGPAVPGWHVRILDDDERELGHGEIGEVCLRARTNPNYPLGYWRRPEETARDFGGAWYHTKDLAYVDADGYFWYVSRKDDLIKSAGYRISPYEVEEALRRHRAVADAAVIGVPDATRGTAVAAFVVLDDTLPGTPDLADELKDWARREHSAFGYPRHVHFVSELPRSSSGKINRAALRQQQAPAS
ncbi:acyl-CoA synthetase [Amycolatopsis sp. 3B14]|uniref:acyl-CoA synthetase n=1 Tax=Amycolatopsis sp. 3B14 TaxID=3243600 RepID=UPI003D9632DA